MESARRETTGGGAWRAVVSRVAMALAVVLVVALVAPWLSFIEVRALDVLYALRPPREPDPRIEIVEIGDDPSVYDYLRDPRESPTQGCETPRLAYAEAVRRLSRWGARVIVFDLWFSRSCQHEDEQLAEAFRQAGNVIVAATTQTKPGAVGLEDPVPPIDEAVWAVGSPVALQSNETVRLLPLVVRDRDSGREYLSLSLLGFQRFSDRAPEDATLAEDGSLLAAGQRVPLLSGEQIHLLSLGGAPGSGESGGGGAVVEVVSGSNVEQIKGLRTWNALVVNWAGPGGTIRPHQLGELLDIDDDEGRASFEGKAVIIGKADWDEHYTAVGAMPGTEIQANALQTLMSGEFIRPISPWSMMAVLAAFALATASAVPRFKGVRAVGVVLLLMAVSLILARQLLAARGIWMYVFCCELGIGLTWGMTVVAESGKVTALLTRFVPSFMGKPEAPAAREVRTMEASILFSDIRGYTALAEQFSPAETLTMLNTFQSALEDIITRHAGTIVKTPGDAILAVFWKDVGPLNHAACAVRSGRQILHDLPELQRSWKAVGATLDIGIGIDSGQVAMGLVGKRHLEPTVIGDAVNVAQRLETLTKTLGCPLIFSENVRERLREDVEAVCFDEVMVRGRQTPLRVYGLAGPGAEVRGPGQEVDLVGQGDE